MTPAAPTAAAQLAALVRLRWQMARAPGVRFALVMAVVVVVWLLVLVTTSTAELDTPVLETAVELAPTAFLGFGALAVVAPLAAGGGSELVPSDQLVAYPVRARTLFLGGLVLAPVNLVWVAQLLTIAAMTSFITYGGRPLLGALTSAAYVAALTAVGQALAWTVAGLRQTRRGRLLVGTTAAVVVATAVVVVRAGLGDDVIDRSPTRTVVAGVAAGDGDLPRWAATTAALVAAAAVALLVGSRACAWALRRPGDSGAAWATAEVRRRRAHRSALRELVAVDRASAWRAPALRRGGVVLAVLPGLVAAGAAVPWQSLVVLPGLVAAGAGLLFGVNAFALDASGAVWLASLPHDPRLALRAKAWVLAETVLVAVTVAALAGSLRSPGQPTSAELTAIVSSCLASTVVVVALCLSGSLRRPHRAELRGPRDAVAPPGALAFASLVLAVPTGFLGVVLEASSNARLWWLPPLVAAPAVLLAGLSLARTARRWDDASVRSRVVQVVSAG